MSAQVWTLIGMLGATLLALLGALWARISSLGTDLGGELRAEMRELRADLRGEMSEMRGEMREMRGELTTLNRRVEGRLREHAG